MQSKRINHSSVDFWMVYSKNNFSFSFQQLKFNIKRYSGVAPNGFRDYKFFEFLWPLKIEFLKKLKWLFVTTIFLIYNMFYIWLMWNVTELTAQFVHNVKKKQKLTLKTALHLFNHQFLIQFYYFSKLLTLIASLTCACDLFSFILQIQQATACQTTRWMQATDTLTLTLTLHWDFLPAKTECFFRYYKVSHL